jgi:hypothetical protein
MKKIFSLTWNLLGAFALLGLAGSGHAEQISHSTFGNIDQWFISEPAVNLPLPSFPNGDVEAGKFYEQISFRPGDTLLVSAGGCVQTGGHGLTWKRYVDPQGPNSDRLYHGLIGLPGLPVMRFQDFFNQYQGRYVAPEVPGSSGSALFSLYLSYEDDGPADNGYYSHATLTFAKKSVLG